MSPAALLGLYGMRIVINEFISLDGVVQAPGGAEEDTDGGFRHGGWSMPYFDPEVMGAAVGEQTANAGALLFGRRTWRVMADAWPSRAGDPMADQMNALPKYVASRTLKPDDMTWNTTLLSADGALDDIAKLRTEEGGDLLVWGSVTLVGALIGAGLVDELNVMIEPITLGGGKRIFPEDGSARPWRLTKSVTAGTGVLVCTYVPAS
jgi:dihydrofolate reductase